MQENFKIRGRDRPDNSISFYMSPPGTLEDEIRKDKPSRYGPSGCVDTFTAVRDSLAQHNPAVRDLVTMAAMPDDGRNYELQLQRAGDPDAPQRLRGEVYSVVSYPTCAVPRPRNVWTFRRRGLDTDRDQAEKICTLTDPMYEALAYPLLYPCGEVSGWTHGNRHGLALGEYAKGRMFIPELLDGTRGTADASYLTYTTASGLRVPCSRLQTMPWLMQQYVLDLHCRQLERDLKFQLFNQDRLTRGGGGNDGEDAGADTPVVGHTAADGPVVGQKRRTVLGKSVRGSASWIAASTANAMSIVRKKGRPLSFITFTCNGSWPELQEMLPDGCTPFDCPDITNRVFKAKLDAFVRLLETGAIYGPANHEVIPPGEHPDYPQGATVHKYRVHGPSGGSEENGYILYTIEFQQVRRHAPWPEWLARRGETSVSCPAAWPTARPHRDAAGVHARGRINPRPRHRHPATVGGLDHNGDEAHRRRAAAVWHARCPRWRPHVHGAQRASAAALCTAHPHLP